MRVEFKGIIAEELSFKMNKNGISVNKMLDINPQFTRQLRVPNNNPNINYLTQIIKAFDNNVYISSQNKFNFERKLK